MLATVVFYLLALVCLVSATLTITLASPVSCALALVVCLMGLAGLFALLSAGYVAILQVLIYAGAIMVLFLFVVMLLNLSEEEAGETAFGTDKLMKSLLAATFMVDVYLFADLAVGGAVYEQAAAAWGGLEPIGEALFKDHLVPFEAVSLLLTAAVAGVVLITRKPAAEKLPSR